jgi:predicted nucleic acid-binding protein
MSSFDDELGLLIGKYGINNIHNKLMNRMRLEYIYSKKVFDEKKKVEKVEKVEKEEKVSVVDIIEDEEVDVENSVVENDVKEVVEEKKYRDPKEMKAWQKGQEEKKRAENLAKGINPKDLLTKENLQKWYGEEGRTFSYIAREYVGCKDSEVSQAVKQYDIKSSRKNIMIKAMKMKKAH